MAQRRGGCIGIHAKALLQMGSTEAAGLPGVAVYTGAGPLLMPAANALAAFQQLRDQSAAPAPWACSQASLPARGCCLSAHSAFKAVLRSG